MITKAGIRPGFFYFGFRYVGKQEKRARLPIIGGLDPRNVDWLPGVLENAAAFGLAPDAFGQQVVREKARA